MIGRFEYKCTIGGYLLGLENEWPGGVVSWGERGRSCGELDENTCVCGGEWREGGRNG